MARDRDWFKSLFNDVSNDNDGFQPSKIDDWTVTTKEGAKRSKARVRFLGTRGTRLDDPTLSREEIEQNRQGQLDFANKNREALDQAVDLLSQSTTGRYLLDEITKAGYRIVFDDRRTGDKGAGGLCDPSTKTIVLKSGRDVEYIALVLGHEATHALQHSKADIFPTSAQKPDVGIMTSFAIEADAYAHQVQIALELANGDPSGPQDQFKTDGPLYQMRKRFPDLVGAAEKTLMKKDSLENGRAMASAFEAFYDNVYLRSFYEDSHIDWCRQFAREVNKSSRTLAKSFNDDQDKDTMLDKILFRGKPYVRENLPNIKMDDARHSGMTVETKSLVLGFYETFKSDLGKPDLAVYGTHMKDAVDWLFNRVSGKNILVFNLPAAPKGKPKDPDITDGDWKKIKIRPRPPGSGGGSDNRINFG